MEALTDITVLELAFYYPGPLCGLVLSDMGARVIKIEPPDGDPMRPYGAKTGRSTGPTFECLNRGKESVVIDLKSEGGPGELLSLCREADVLLSVLRPAVMDRLGLDAETIRRENPALVHCRMSGYGTAGPYADRAGHDLNYEAVAGILGLNGTADGRLALGAVPVADLSGALLAALAIVGAVRERDRTGRGRTLDVSLTDGALVANAINIVGRGFDEEEPEPGRMLLTGRIPAYNVYRSSDGRWFALGALEPKFWVAFCRAVEREDLMPLQMDPSAVTRLRELFGSRDARYWSRIASDNDVCLEPVLRIDEVGSHPQVRARGLLLSEPDGRRTMAFPGLGAPGPDGRRAPELGEHTHRIRQNAAEQDGSSG
jgi:crotonobetainyl-CoA:carnitine CoA-transferase CaiB-like acyl-CoA transferase